MLTLLINATGIILILLIIWWFWLGSKGKTAIAKDRTIDIMVDSGIYDPSVITAQVGNKINLRFTRQDASPCAETVIFAELNQSLDLPVNTPTQLELIVDKTGEYEFTCPMGMYRGKLVITE